MNIVKNTHTPVCIYTEHIFSFNFRAYTHLTLNMCNMIISLCVVRDTKNVLILQNSRDSVQLVKYLL